MAEFLTFIFELVAAGALFVVVWWFLTVTENWATDRDLDWLWVLVVIAGIWFFVR